MCLKETWQNLEFQDCLKEVETWFRDEDTQKSKLLPDFEDMGWVKWCMTKKKEELKVRFIKLLKYLIIDKYVESNPSILSLNKLLQLGI